MRTTNLVRLCESKEVSSFADVDPNIYLVVLVFRRLHRRVKMKKKAATSAKKGINPFTKEPCVFKSNPASNTLRALAMKKLKEALN